MKKKQKMMMILFVVPLYIIFLILLCFFYKNRRIINMLSDVSNFFDLDVVNTPKEAIEEFNKREFLMEQVKNGESISNSKTPWTVKKLKKASEKVIEKVYEKYKNPEPLKINKHEAMRVGRPICPTIIKLYAEGLKSILEQIPYVSEKYTINVEKLKNNISDNDLFCESLAIKVGSKIIEQAGSNSATHMGFSLASMTLDAVEPIEEVERIEEKSE